jgi:hypothetical protein
MLSPKLWIIVYTHRYGVDTWPILSYDEEPDIDEIITDLKENECTDFDPDQETIEIRGPWSVEIQGPRMSLRHEE